jgi:hypothetical protein
MSNIVKRILGEAGRRAQTLDEGPIKDLVSVAKQAQEIATAASAEGRPEEATKWADEASKAAEDMDRHGSRYSDQQMIQAHGYALRAHKAAGICGKNPQYHVDRAAFHSRRLNFYSS